MNNTDLAKLKDPKFYLENFCKVKNKSGGMVPFVLKEAQKDIFNTMRTQSRVMILKARQIGFCLDKSTKILSNNLEWITLEDIKVGQEIIAVDELTPGQGKSRKMRTAIVEAKFSVYEEAFKITMDDGRELIATGKHRFLSKKWNSSTEIVWKEVSLFHVGDRIRYITKPWTNGSFEDGWFGGILDGEGHLSKKSRTGVALTASQVEGFVWERMLKYAQNSNFSFRIEWDKRTSRDSSKFGDKPVGKIVFSRMDEVFQILGKTRPERFMKRNWWDDKETPSNGWAKIISIESLGQREMIDLQTSAKTYIAEGFVSHNSTAVTGYLYHRTITTPGRTTALIGYNSSLTTELLDKIKTFLRTTPPELRPTVEYNSKYEISFPKLNSKILVLPSTENVGRGYTITDCLCTELAFWDKPEEKMTALENSVPIDGKIIIESTPNGQGNLYHRMWMAEDNGYAKKAYGWWWEYGEEHIELVRKRMNNPRKFAQEYELEFLASGRSVFDQAVVKEQRKNILNVGDVRVDKDGKEFIVREEDDWIIFAEPEVGGLYVMGADVSEGVEGGDYSVATIINRVSGEEVAAFRKYIPPDIFGVKLDKMGRRYNNALAVPEINNHGLTTVTILKQRLYPSIYFRPTKFDSLGSSTSDKLGWLTNKKTKPIMIDDLAQGMRDHELTFHSRYFIDELTVFVYDDAGNMTPQEGFHDDCIMASAMAFQGFKILYDKKLDQLDSSIYLPTSFAY